MSLSNFQYYNKYDVYLDVYHKCAQTSLLHYFGAPWLNQPGVFGYPNPIRNLKKWKWSERFEIIAFIRNPFDRVVSQYFYHMEYLRKRLPEYNNYTFKDYVEDHMKGSKKIGWVRPICDYPTWNVLGYCPTFIGRYETFDDDLRRVHEKFKIEFNGIPWINKSTLRKKVPYKEMYTEDFMISHVMDFYKKDLEKFNYKF